jgi:fucose permease
LHAFFGVGAFIAPLIVAQVLSVTGDIYWVYWFFAIAAFPMALWIWNLPSPASRAVPAQHENSAFPILPVLIMVLCFVLYVGGEAGYGAWIYTYAFTLNFGTEISAAYLTAAFWGSFTLGRLLGIWVSTLAKPLTILGADSPLRRISHCFVDWDDPLRSLTSLDLPYIPDPRGRTNAYHRNDRGFVPRGSWHRRHDPAMVDWTSICASRCHSNDGNDFH